MSAKALRSQAKKPSLNIHRYTSATKIHKLKTHSKKERHQEAPSNGFRVDQQPGTSQQPVERNSPEYLEALLSQIYSKLAPDRDSKHEDYLPALTSSSEIDAQLHAIIGLLLQNFVLGWYGRITDDYSNEFLLELIYVVAHLTRNVEERLRTVDYKELIFDDVFVVFDWHMQNYRKAVAVVGSGLVSYRDDDGLPEADGLERLMDLFQPHVGIQNQTMYLKTLSACLLERTLPRELVDSELTQSILVTLINEFALKLAVEKLSEPYLIWEITGKVCDALAAEKSGPRGVEAKKKSWSDVTRSISHGVAYMTSALSTKSFATNAERPVMQYHIFTFANRLFGFVQNLTVTTMLVSLFGRLFGFSDKLNHILQNLLNNILLKFVIREQFIAQVLAISRSVIFPKDDVFYLEPRFIPTTEEELAVLRNDTKAKILKVVDAYPIYKTVFYYKDDERLDEDVTAFLQAFGSKNVNKHLTLLLLDVIFLRVFPDMAAAPH